MLRKRLHVSIALSGLLFIAQQALARPLLTEEVATIGRLHFEAGATLSRRNDKFSPDTTYETNQFPVFARIGVHRSVDLGFTLMHISHTMDRNGASFSGTSSGQFSPEIKYSPSDYYGFKAIWNVSKAERNNDNLPIGQGNDLELLSLFASNTPWPIQANIGYVIRGNYYSQFGVPGSDPQHLSPGNIFESKIALEIPIRYNISLLTETAYYHAETSHVDQIHIPDSAGDAWDVLVGTTWAYKGWNIGGGVGFGVGNEKHSSFDVRRGAGDTLYRLTFSYNLTPTSPDKQ